MTQVKCVIGGPEVIRNSCLLLRDVLFGAHLDQPVLGIGGCTNWEGVGQMRLMHMTA